MSNDTSAVYNILAYSFAGQDTAKKTVEEIKSSDALDDTHILAQIIVEQDANGKVHIHETGHGTMGAMVGGLAGSAINNSAIELGGRRRCDRWCGWQVSWPSDQERRS